jgi:hypothetical protein
MITPGGLLSSDTNIGGLPGGPGAPTIGPICNGVPCTVASDPGRPIAPNVTFASYWAQPWGHVDFAGILVPLDVNDGRYISWKFLGYGGHISGDVKPGWFGWAKDDFHCRA